MAAILKENKIMVTAFILINVERPELKNVINEVLNTDGVTEVYSAAGEYDLVAIARVKSNQELSKIVVDRLPHEIKGITHTKTLMALDCNSKVDLEKVFFN